MRILTLIIFIFIVYPPLFGYTSEKSEEQEISHVVKTNVSSLVTTPLFNSYVPIGATYEYVFADKQSISINPYVGIGSLIIGVNTTWRYYLNGTERAPNGFFLGVPVGIYFTSRTLVDGTNSSSLTLGVGGTTGYQWIISHGFTIDAFIAPRIDFSTSISGPAYTAINLILSRTSSWGIQLGYAF